MNLRNIQGLDPRDVMEVLRRRGLDPSEVVIVFDNDRYCEHYLNLPADAARKLENLDDRKFRRLYPGCEPLGHACRENPLGERKWGYSKALLVPWIEEFRPQLRVTDYVLA